MIGPSATRVLLLFAFVSLAVGCSSVKILSKNELSSGKYRVRQKGGKFQKTDVVVAGDSIEIYDPHGRSISMTPGLDQFYLEGSLDFDLMIAPFKYRSATPSLPRQLTTSFNAHLFTGYRLDRFHVRFRKSRQGYVRTTAHRSVGLGVFGGISSVVIGPWTTNYQTPDEYSGLAISRGVMLLGGVDSLTFGLALGLDRLTDRDKNIWIYQNRPWYGITIGININ